MIRTKRAFLAAITGLLCLHATAQSGKLPNTFLWRITGNGLQQPSYLFGSIHVKDRRVFQFTDSLYHFLQTVDSYAMEIDPDEAMAAVFKTIGEPDNSPLLKDEMEPADFKKIAKDLEQKYGVPASRITKKQAWLYKKGLDENPKQKPTDMDAVIDLYLYQIAKQSGKWVGGIEDVEDQLNLIEEMKTSYEASDLLESRMQTGNSIERLIQIYLAQDLTKLNSVVNEIPAGQRDTLLVIRNHKMARRMDSLVHIRSQFFTVGAAHLPGTEGVLQLLQERGFTLTPVFSKTHIAPEKYTYTKKELFWQTITDAEKTYSIEMPGKPSALSPDGVYTMQVYADLGTGLFYFAGAFPMAATKNTDSLLRATSKRFLATGRLKSPPQPIVYQGLKGIEVLKDSSNYTFRMRLLTNGSHLVLVMMGSEKSARLYGEEARHFYNSLTLSAPKERPVITKDTWQRFTNERWGVQVSFPDVPQPNTVMQKNLEARDGTHSWNYSNQTVLDVVGNSYYMLITREARAGFDILDDNSLFEESKHNIENTGEVNLIRYDTGRWHGLPAMWMEGDYKKQNLRMKALTVNRGNRSYVLMVVFDKASDSTNADFYLNSLQLPEPKKAFWQNYTDPLHRFTTQAPQPLLLKKATDSTRQTMHTIIAHDSLSARSYQVQIEAIPAYFWTTNDSTLYASLLQRYRAQGDSLMQEKQVTTGPATGREFWMLTANKRNTKRLRFFPNGDSVYVLYTATPAVYTSTEGDAFFDNFRFNTYRQPVQVFKNHTDVLLQQLHSTDSATFAAAKDFVESAPFTTVDVPQLHQAMLQLYPDWDSTFSEVQNNLFGKAIQLDPNGTVRFIEQQYSSLTGTREALKYRMLIGLGTIKTTAAYGLLKKLLTADLPKAGDSGGLGSVLSDSLALTQTLFPAVLAQAGDSLFYDPLVQITNTLIDSNLLQAQALAPYSNLIVGRAKQLWQAALLDGNTGWRLYEPIQLLGKLNTSAANALLQEISKGHYLGVKEAAIIALLRNNQPVAAATLVPVAADRYNRMTLYEDLKKLNKLSLFPAVYRNQKSLAESGLYQMASEDYESSKMIFVGTRTSTYKGSKKLFYLWKVQYADASETYLGVAGPYDGVAAPLISDPEFLQVLDDVFDAGKIDSQLHHFLQDQESYK